MRGCIFWAVIGFLLSAGVLFLLEFTDVETEWRQWVNEYTPLEIDENPSEPEAPTKKPAEKAASNDRGLLSGLVHLAREAADGPPGAPVQIISSSGESALTVNQRWHTLDGFRPFLGEPCQIQVGLRSGTAQVLVYEESRDEANTSLGEYSDSTKDFILLNHDKAEVFNGPIDVMIGGMRGIQYVLDVTEDGQKMKVLHTSLLGRSNYYQLIAVIDPERLEAVQLEILEIVRSFRENGSQSIPASR
ncbi:MAG: hypothetical protein ACFB21_13025 [Opitutales bacterium]